jgi:chitinase
MRKLIVFFMAVAFVFVAVSVHAGQVTLQWDANDPAPEGYKIFVREDGQLNYDYSAPAWSGPETTATLELSEGVLYYFVVRAFEGVLQSENSEEVNYQMPSVGLPKVNGTRIDRVVIININ